MVSGDAMTELEKILVSDGAAAAPARIVAGVPEEVAHRRLAGAPHTIYQELWHILFWQQISLDWARGIETAYPENPQMGFATAGEELEEPWEALCARFAASLEEAGAVARDAGRLEVAIRCPSRPGEAVRTMTVREQMENMAAHNGYHLGRIVLMRQCFGVWGEGGFTW